MTKTTNAQTQKAAEGSTRRVSARVDYWHACTLIGEAKAAKIWAAADADQDEKLSIAAGS